LSYADQNARTATLYGLSRALRTAENRPHGLTDLASAVTGLASAAADPGSYGDRAGRGIGTTAALRFLLSPGVQSRTGIALYGMGQLPAAQFIRAALLARLRGEAVPTPTTEEPR
jgi:hypothetical protein